MINKIVVFKGSKKDFKKLLDQCIDKNDETIPFMDLIQKYNARLRPNETGVKESELKQRIYANNCIVEADDYGSVLEHVLSNFVNIVCQNHDIDVLYVQNPPKRVLGSLESYTDDIEYLGSKYKKITKILLKKIYSNLSNDILGQEKCKKQLTSGLYKLSFNQGKKPSVLLLYGPSGVGKTETAKSVSESMGGNLLRIQFSMMQTNEAYNYVYGSEHSRSSFAKDLQGRETNIVLIDEFDKVNPGFYNAFYELFDEGRFVDTNYDVDCSRTIFICTSNFNSEEEIKKTLGPAMFSRIGCCLKYSEISNEQKIILIEKWYKEILEKLDKTDREVIFKSDIKDWFVENVVRYDNLRLLKTRLENAVYDELTTLLIE